jgi:hypothetical protein
MALKVYAVHAMRRHTSGSPVRTSHTQVADNQFVFQSIPHHPIAVMTATQSTAMLGRARHAQKPAKLMLIIPLPPPSHAPQAQAAMLLLKMRLSVASPYRPTRPHSLTKLQSIRPVALPDHDMWGPLCQCRNPWRLTRPAPSPWPSNPALMCCHAAGSPAALLSATQGAAVAPLCRSTLQGVLPLPPQPLPAQLLLNI